MTYGPTFYVNKTSGTFADALTAYGLAKVLEGVLINSAGPQTAREIMIRDVGPYYTVELPASLRDEWVENCTFFMPVRSIKQTERPDDPSKPKKNAPKSAPKKPVEETPNAWDYKAEWERSGQYREAAEAFRQAVKNGQAADSDTAMALADLKPSPMFDVLTLIGDTLMQATKLYNNTVLRWYQTRDQFTVNLKTILELTSTPDANLDEIAIRWSRSIPKTERTSTASQLFNPSQGQGQNHPKSNRVDTRHNLDNFWLLEFLKMVGIWECAAPRKVYDKKKRYGEQDRKTYVLAPRSLSLGLHRSIFQKFSERLWSKTAVKMDCEVALLYTKTLLEYSETEKDADEVLFEDTGPEDLVAGFQVALYKQLNPRAYTMLSISFVGLPCWTGEVKTRARVDELKGVVDEHLRVLQAIDESHSDGYLLLQDYRDFLSGHQWDAFFAFTVGYGQYLMAEWNKQNLRPAQFTTKNLRRLLMSSEARFSEIVENEGFRAIATAIRGSTVIPQYQMARFRQGKGEKPLYEVRYGLGQELKRKAAYKQEFLIALSDFLQSFDQENAQKAERQAQRRKNICTGDIADLVQLVDKFDSEVVCNLLVAFGYARDPKEQPDE